MRRTRRIYYDKFSRFYDRFVALHSRDKQGLARKFLVELVPGDDGGSVLDLCTGTGTLLPLLQEKLVERGRAIGADFSHGMLMAAKTKTRDLGGIALTECDAAFLPFANESFEAVTCSHAFYELRGETQTSALKEIIRVLKPNGTFLMMEHDVPTNPIVRLLFYIRLASMGTAGAVKFLRQEEQVLRAHFVNVSKVLAPAGRSKVMICRKGPNLPDRGLYTASVTAHVGSH
jgi:ubiquinone/menaquinone biosynthesis C-methylase UbiE